MTMHKRGRKLKRRPTYPVVDSANPKSDIHAVVDFGVSPDVFQIGVDGYKNIFYRRGFEDASFSMWTSAVGMAYFLAKEILERDGHDVREKPQYRRP